MDGIVHLINGNAQMADFITGFQRLLFVVMIFPDQFHNGYQLLYRLGNIAGHQKRKDKEQPYYKAQHGCKDTDSWAENVFQRFFGNTV